jgi:hypothetical protein
LRRKLQHLNAPSADTGPRAGVIRHSHAESSREHNTNPIGDQE